jgi:transcriptional regulator with XRE-family HTH domain
MEINGASLRAIREAQGWTKSRLAAEAKISLPYLRDLEKGRRKGRNPGVVKSLATALKVPMAAISKTTEDAAQAS